MPGTYLIVKLIHIVSASVLFGTGLGTAYFMFRAWRSGNAEALRVTSRHVVIADWLFTLPAVIVQLTTGLWLTTLLGIPWSSVWFGTVILLFGTVGLLWTPVVLIQIRIARIASSAGDSAIPGDQIDRLMRTWTALGAPAFALTLVLFGLMVLKIGLA